MKKIALILLIIITLFSCNSDNPEEKTNILEHIKITNSFNQVIINEYYLNGDKFINSYKNNSIDTEVSYYDDDKISKYTTYQYGGISLEYIFSYDENGQINSVHEFNIQHIPQNQDRTAIWSGNKMIIPYINNNKTELYEFSFNDIDLLINFKHTLQNGQVLFNSQYEYDSNENMIRKHGENQNIAFDITYSYDDKDNPRYFSKKINRKNYFIMMGKSYPFFGTRIYFIDKLIRNFGKNNNLTEKDLLNDTFVNNYFIHSYSSNTTIQTKVKSTEDDSFEVVYDFYYDD